MWNADCFGSYCIMHKAQGGKYQYFPPNWLVFPSKVSSSGNITLGMLFTLWLVMIQT